MGAGDGGAGVGACGSVGVDWDWVFLRCLREARCVSRLAGGRVLLQGAQKKGVGTKVAVAVAAAAGDCVDA